MARTVRVLSSSLLFLAILLVTLGFGWWPLRFFVPNNVTWDKDESAFDFQLVPISRKASTGGIVYSEEAFSLADATGVSILVEARGKHDHSGLGMIVELLDPDSDSHPLLKVAQWRQHLAVRSGRTNDPSGRAYSEIGYRDTFSPTEFRRVLLSSDFRSTTIRIQGMATHESEAFALIERTEKTKEQKLRVVVGNGEGGTEPFEGSIRRIAVYSSSIGSWGELEKSEPILLLDASDSNHKGFIVPRYFSPLRVRFLNIPSQGELGDPNRKHDMVLNLWGFLPLGLSLTALLTNWYRLPKSCLLALLGSILVSLAIELPQGFLPWRDSSMLDLILNSLGGGVGVIAFLGFDLVRRRFRA